ncbi:hypothetical protein [Curtobacterium sp. MCBD17_028]|uniref:hypothetical protein n=1 Tax=Curtobacterium sp. MCBD17_028 TaxID=2175670 RepID=UPI000DA6F788|nr:hypothetical protein [Curtobacterium sp. MCBD17_028]PZE23872.1 hypothetical protein DEI86_13595 [Curtobacterium sp. MCBD17_028]
MTEQEYTPTTEQVRENYYASPGVIEWEASRAAAFDRWLAAHEAEVRASVQVPTREQIDTAVGAVLFNASNYPRPAVPHIAGQDIAPLRTKVTDAVLALLSQPKGDD